MEEVKNPPQVEYTNPVYYGEEPPPESYDHEVTVGESPNRDPGDLNSHVKVSFPDTIAEPDGLRSLSCSWSCSRALFNCCKAFNYYMYTIFCGWFMAIYWGCCFACVGFYQVWCLTPCFRMCEILTLTVYRLYKLFYKCCCDPFFESCGRCCSQIHVHHHNSEYKVSEA